MSFGHPQIAPQPGLVAGQPTDDMIVSPEAASAPPLHDLSVPFGYEKATFSPVTLQPPTAAVDSGLSAANVHRAVPQMAQIREEEVREALKEFVNDNCCYGKRPAVHMEIKDIIMRSTFQYKLETFTERRETNWKYEPFQGQPIDGPNNGVAPSPWEVYAMPQVSFEYGKKRIEVPHTAVVRLCHSCAGNGRIRCKPCNGFGGSNCIWCHGSGRRDDMNCMQCNATGRCRCIHCRGHGQVKCHTCIGFGQLKCFIELTVHWTNNVDDYVSDDTGLSEQSIKEATGSVAFEERFPRLYPLSNFPDERISRASKGLIQKHLTNFPLERIIEQRHKVLLIPVAVVCYRYKEKDGMFYVYGLEHKVSFDDYPARCCCGICTIL